MCVKENVGRMQCNLVGANLKEERVSEGGEIDITIGTSAGAPSAVGFLCIHQQSDGTYPTAQDSTKHAA